MRSRVSKTRRQPSASQAETRRSPKLRHLVSELDVAQRAKNHAGLRSLLAALEQYGIYYLDAKPGNIMFKNVR
jgi:hypothetical protein